VNLARPSPGVPGEGKKKTIDLLGADLGNFDLTMEKP
jgi:hypothetical protein